jgi:hypothetical protein
MLHHTDSIFEFGDSPNHLLHFVETVRVAFQGEGGGPDLEQGQTQSVRVLPLPFGQGPVFDNPILEVPAVGPGVSTGGFEIAPAHGFPEIVH